MDWRAAAAIIWIWATPALADGACRDEALAVLGRGATSGPFRFEAQSTHPNPGMGPVRSTGVVVPPDRSSVKTADEAGVIATEEVQIGRAKWVRFPTDDHWRVSEAPAAATGAAGMAAPDADRFARVSCLGRVTEAGRDYLGYEYELKAEVSPRWGKSLSSTLRVLADPATKAPARITIRAETEPGRFQEKVETRTYDSGLKVEPPDRAEIWARLVDRFRAAAARADGACRKATLASLQAALAAGPFRVEVTTEGKVSHRVAVQPPGTLQVVEPGVETIIAGYRLCTRAPAQDWRCGPDNVDAFTLYLRDTLPYAASVRDAQCLGEVTEEGHRYTAYEYVYSEGDLRRATVRKMLVDSATGLPARFEVRDVKGALRWTARWMFDPGLKIETPSAIASGN